MTVLPDEGFTLAAEFPGATREQWQRLVEGVLRKAGADVSGEEAEAALATRLQDGIATRPLYTAEDGAPDPGLPGFPPYLRGARPEGNAVQGWDIRQRHADPSPKRANEAILADLENGVTSLWLAVGPAGIPVDALPAALEGVYLDLAAVALDPGAEALPAAEALFALLDAKETGRDEARGTLGADPLGELARTGEEPFTAAEAAALAARCLRERPGLRALVADGLPYHEAGASPAQELGCALATGVAYLRALSEAGLPLRDAFAQLEFRYAAGADQFLTIATLRAARRLWARVAEAAGAPAAAAAQRQHAVTSPVMMTRRDPWVNMLRTTVATLGAGVGGADAVTVLPFDDALGLPDPFARRIARNTSSVLLAEAHLGRVVDPAGGSWYVERLTEDLARAAWAWFQEIERAGGQAAALDSGLIGERIAATWERRAEDLAHRREPITGVSEFPDAGERELVREPAPARPGGGLPRVRRDQAFEALRARSDAHLAATGARPRAFLAALGRPAAHSARATFAANLLRAGGIEPVHDPVTVDAASAGNALAAAGTPVAVVCGSDALYAEHASDLARALKAAGAGRVLLAGRPGALRDGLQSAGVDEFVFAGGDAVAVLSSLLDSLGVA
ncbi:methylmalonyl-CoA mutase small subunit [Streptomyces sp. DSM 44917]|uniref:Methylmalonyl-CoA mutase small subunit n=1 Tax=Streptomyces boetiae TaxID=3075541 RepID=A0ABU2L5U6_9ACTN|nr:methylmalonyl-CoA mutase small subunit [Streptomyces sp. DSM 44917]MDT0306900.1 methylmalonyl-CoA mutase small subunit [Streptomyces sp. DSM 44917]